MPECLKVAEAAGQIIGRAWGLPRAVRHKGRADLVTNTDFEVQAFLRRELNSLLPEAGFLGEEDDGEKTANADLLWVVDPVDGTTNFVHRIPLVAISLALCAKGKPVLGIVNSPILGEIFYAVKGTGAFLNENPIHVSGAATLEDSLVCTGFPYDLKDGLDQMVKILKAVLPATQGLRRLGSAATDLAYVACGRLDAFYESCLKPWDMAAGWLLVEEAGGRITMMDGSEMSLGASLLSSNGHIHDSMLRLLNQ